MRSALCNIVVRSTKSHNAELASEISELQKSYTELTLLKESLENRESTMQGNLTDAQKEANALKVWQIV